MRLGKEESRNLLTQGFGAEEYIACFIHGRALHTIQTADEFLQRFEHLTGNRNTVTNLRASLAEASSALRLP